MPIVIYTGGLGQGKTIAMVRALYKHSKDMREIKSNLTLKPPIESSPLTMDDLNNYRTWSYNKMCIALDELHILMDSRKGMRDRNIVMSYWFTQTRKRDVHFYGTTQFLHQIDKRIRDVADYIIYCDCIEIPEKDNDEKKTYIVLRPYDRTYDKWLPKEVFYANPYFKMYDTYEIIDFNITQEDIIVKKILLELRKYDNVEKEKVLKELKKWKLTKTTQHSIL